MYCVYMYICIYVYLSLSLALYIYIYIYIYTYYAKGLAECTSAKDGTAGSGQSLLFRSPEVVHIDREKSKNTYITYLDFFEFCSCQC